MRLVASTLAAAGVGTVARRCSLLVALLGAAPAALAQGAAHECLITPYRVVAVGSSASGVLEAVEVDRGDRVRAGEIIARLRSGVERAAVDLAKARAEFEQRRVARNENLGQDELISEHDRDEMLTQSLIANLELAEANELLEMRTIRSPLDGVVVERTGSPGELVQDSSIATVAQIDPLNVEVVLPVALFGSIAVGDTAQVLPAEPVGGDFAAKVVIVDQVIDAASGTFGVRLELPNRDFALPAGLQCRVRFPTGDGGVAGRR